jgi:hypothetical protein
VKNAFLDRLIERRNGSAKRWFRSRFIPAAQGLAHFAKSGPQARGVAAIPLGTSFGLTRALERRKMICHYFN